MAFTPALLAICPLACTYACLYTWLHLMKLSRKTISINCQMTSQSSLKAARQLENANQRYAWTLPEPQALKESSGKLSIHALKDVSA